MVYCNKFVVLFKKLSPFFCQAKLNFAFRELEPLPEGTLLISKETRDERLSHY
jgi:hypothetical protein